MFFSLAKAAVIKEQKYQRSQKEFHFLRLNG
jgi:hypothetical protein